MSRKEIRKKYAQINEQYRKESRKVELQLTKGLKSLRKECKHPQKEYDRDGDFGGPTGTICTDCHELFPPD